MFIHVRERGSSLGYDGVKIKFHNIYIYHIRKRNPHGVAPTYKSASVYVWVSVRGCVNVLLLDGLYLRRQILRDSSTNRRSKKERFSSKVPMF